jgi:adenylate kinase
MYWYGSNLTQKTKLVITGNPGVGKHTSAKSVIKKIGCGNIIDINGFAISHDAILNRHSNYGLEVDTKKLAKLLALELRRPRDLTIIVGHLAPYVLRRSDIDLVTVLRRSPYDLIKTFKQRRYSVDKIRENVASEIIGVSFYDSLRTFGKEKVAEVDTTFKKPGDVATQIILALDQKIGKEIGIVDWLSMVHEKGDLQKFFEY